MSALTFNGGDAVYEFSFDGENLLVAVDRGDSLLRMVSLPAEELIALFRLQREAVYRCKTHAYLLDDAAEEFLRRAAPDGFEAIQIVF